MGGLAILTIKTSNKTNGVTWERIYETSITVQKAYRQIHIHMAVLFSRSVVSDPL